MKGRFIRRLLGGSLSLVYLAVNGVWAHTPEAAFWAERRQAAKTKQSSPVGWLASLPLAGPGSIPSVLGGASRKEMPPAGLPSSIVKTLPPAFFKENASLLAVLSTAEGSIRRIRLPRNGAPSKIILHVQDVHLNADAQTRISALVMAANGRHAVDLVGLEGAFGPLDFSKYRRFPRRETIVEVARALLEKGDISGPIHAALAGTAEPPVYVGVDDGIHYRANVDAYRTAAPLQEPIRRRWDGEQSQMQRRKTQVFSAALAAFDTKVDAYREGRLSLGDYLQSLATALPRVPPSLSDFLSTWKQEKALNVGQAERERQILVDHLGATLSPEALTSLAAAAAACRAGSTTYAEFYRQLSALCDQAGISLNTVPALSAYIRYVFAADKILPEQLFHDIRSAEDEAYARVARSPEERALVAESRHLCLLKKLTEFSLTPEEWAEYSKDQSAMGSDRAEMSSFENFYKEAQARDESMTRNFLTAMEKQKAKTALLVTGGFHSGGMEERFLKAGAAVVSFTPRIDKIDTAQGSAYLSVFTREKTPLERMFQGRTLFLTPPVYSATVQHGTAAMLAVALEAAQGDRGSPEGSHFSLLQPFPSPAGGRGGVFDGTPPQTFKSLSSAPGAENATITTSRLPDDRVGVTVKLQRMSTTLWVKLTTGGGRILAYDPVLPGEERTWVEQIKNRHSFLIGILWGAIFLFSVGALFGFLSAPDVQQVLLVSAVSIKRGAPRMDPLVSAVQRLVDMGRNPSVNGRPLAEFIKDPMDLTGESQLKEHLKKYCVLQSERDIVSVMEAMGGTLAGRDPPHSTRQLQIHDVYEGLFEQETYLKRHFSENNPLRIVIFRGGRAAASLTREITKNPLFGVTVIGSGTDTGRSWSTPGYWFGAPGVPDLGKGLLDLAQDPILKDFLGCRFQADLSREAEQAEIELLKDFEGLTEYLNNGETSRSSPALAPWIAKASLLSPSERKQLGTFFETFLRILKTIHSDQVIGHENRNLDLPAFTFNNIPLRSLALLGAVWTHQANGFPDPWQKAIQDLSALLKLRPNDGVRLAPSSPHQLIALTADGTLFFGETGINEYPRDSDNEIVALWMMDRFRPLEEMYEAFTQETGLPLEPPTVDELNAEEVDPSVHEELLATVRRLPRSMATKGNIEKLSTYFGSRSRSVLDAKNPLVVHEDTVQSIKKAHVILSGPGTQESNIGSSMLPPGIRKALEENPEAVKIFAVNITEESGEIRATGASLFRRYYRLASGQGGRLKTRVDWKNARRYVDYVLGRSTRTPGVDPHKVYIPYNAKMIEDVSQGQVYGVAIDLEETRSRPRQTKDYSTTVEEHGFFSDPLTVESMIALHALKSAGLGLTHAGGLTRRRPPRPPALPSHPYADHLRMIRRRMSRFGIDPTVQKNILDEITRFDTKSQRWFYARLMRALEFPVQQWLPQCQNAEWTEMTSRMVELINSITECYVLDYDDSLEERNTDLSPENAKRLAERIAAGKKIVISTAKTQDELASVVNARRHEPGVEIFTPLRTALIQHLQAEQGGVSLEIAAERADDLLHDLYFLYMNNGGTLARPTDRGLTRAIDLPLDEIYTVVYPSDLKDQITKIVEENFPDGFDRAMDEIASESESPLLKVYQTFLKGVHYFNKIIFQPWGSRRTEKEARARVADDINRLLEQNHISARVTAAGTTSIDVNLLINNKIIVKRRAIEHLFNQGHKFIVVIDNEIVKGNAVSVRELLVEMVNHQDNQGRTLLVVAVDQNVTEEQFRKTMGLEAALVHHLPADAIQPRYLRPSEQSFIVVLNGLSGREATQAYFDNSLYGLKAARVQNLFGHNMHEGVLTVGGRMMVGKLYALNSKGRRESRPVTIRQKVDKNGEWGTMIERALKELSDRAKTLGTLQSITVVVHPALSLPDLAQLSPHWEEELGIPLTFSFPKRTTPHQSLEPHPFSVREKEIKAVGHGVLALFANGLVLTHLLLGIGTGWVWVGALLAMSFFVNSFWQATLARNAQRRLMALSTEWDPANAALDFSESLNALKTQFERFGFTPIPKDPLSFTVAINGGSVKVRLPKDRAEFSNLLSRDRLAETWPMGDTHEIVIAPNINPALLSAVVLTEIHRVSPRSALVAYFVGKKWGPSLKRSLFYLLGGSVSLPALGQFPPTAIPPPPTVIEQREKERSLENISATHEIALTQIMIILKMNEAGTIPQDQFLAALEKYEATERTLFLATQSPEEAEESLKKQLDQVASHFTDPVAKSIPEGHPFYLAAQLKLEGMGIGPRVESSPSSEDQVLAWFNVFLQQVQFQADVAPLPVSRQETFDVVKKRLQASVDEAIAVMRQNNAVGTMDPRTAYALLAMGGESLDAAMNKGLLDIVAEGLRTAVHPEIKTVLLSDTSSLFPLFVNKMLREKRMEQILKSFPAEERIAFSYRVKVLFPKGVSPMGGGNPLSGAPAVNSAIYGFTRDWRWGLAGVALFEIPLLILLGPEHWILTLSLFSLAHVFIEAWQNPERPWGKHVWSFFIHFLVASPYAFIGAPGDAMTIIAGTVHLLYDGVLMGLDQARLAHQDMRSFGVPLAPEPRRPLLDLLMPPLESLDINGLDGRAVLLAQATQRMKAGGPYAHEWGGKVDTLVSFHQVMMDDLPALREFIKNRPGKEKDHFQILLVPGASDPALEKALEELAGKNVTALKHSFEPSGAIKINGAHFQSWSHGKGAIAWLTTRNPRAVPLLPDSALPLLDRLLKLLESAPPLTHAHLDAIAAFARAFLTAA